MCSNLRNLSWKVKSFLGNNEIRAGQGIIGGQWILRQVNSGQIDFWALGLKGFIALGAKKTSREPMAVRPGVVGEKLGF